MTGKQSLLQRLASWLALPHRWRLVLVLVPLALSIGARVSLALGWGDAWLTPELRDQIETVLDVLALVLGVGGADAIAVEVRRRDPSVPAIRDDVRSESRGES